MTLHKERVIKFKVFNNDGLLCGYEFLSSGRWLKCDSDGERIRNGIFDSFTNRLQFTGLFDKEGKEIYDCDILEENGYIYTPVEFSQLELGRDGWSTNYHANCWNVGYSDGSGRTALKTNVSGHGLDVSKCTILGSSISNPELLTT
jgi:hypothetical protein